MDKIKIKINGADFEVQKGMRADEAVKEFDKKLYKKLVAVKINGELKDSSYIINEDCSVDTVDFNSKEGKSVYWHTASHIMAQAVKRLYPEAKLAIGPAIEEGFYYDIDVEKPFNEEDLKKIEEECYNIIKENIPTEKIMKKHGCALEDYKKQGEIYKVEIINDDIKDAEISFYKQGEFEDLCRGPHLTSTGRIGAIKLLKHSGSYWRGDEKNKMLQRIYGIAFPDKKELKEYLRLLEEAKKRDHRVLGTKLDLFSICDEAGAGLVIWHPKGALLRYLIEEFERKEHLKRGYSMVVGPQILKMDMWKKSGHYDNYKENMYMTEVDGSEYGIKPMNCLSHMLIYKSRLKSYRDMPVRYFELGTVHRHEKSGVLHGLLRVRSFTQDDAHIICRPDQLNDEIKGVLDFIVDVMKMFDFQIELELSTRPEKSIGSDEDWEKATAALKEALVQSGFDYDINEGDGAFYGPKIDVKLKDCLNRRWQCATIQCDFTLPERFDLSYIGEDGLKHRPVMIHRVILGSIERFIGIMIEHYAGDFPLKFSPEQMRVVTVNEELNDYASGVRDYFKEKGARVSVDLSSESLSKKIRNAELEKVPLIIVCGNKEKDENKINVRFKQEKRFEVLTKEELYDKIKKSLWI